MKYIIWLFVLILLSSCRDDVVDISQLSLVHQRLFTEAASREGVSVTTDKQPWELDVWTVGYDYEMADVGYYINHSFLDAGIYCDIWINPNKLSMCKIGGNNQYFIVVSQHELRHCINGPDHSKNPQSLMYKDAPCCPED